MQRIAVLRLNLQNLVVESGSILELALLMERNRLL